MDVEARVAGKTLGAVFYVDELLDANGQVPKEFHENMGKVMQAVTRVALSTDLTLNFCTVIMRDKKQGNELVITRRLDDIKRAQADALGMEESMNRTLFGQSKYILSPTGKTPFILEDIQFENFLAEQMVQRIRFYFAKDVKEDPSHPFLLADGHFITTEGKKSFRFSLLALKSENPKETILQIFKLMNDVLKGYQFMGYDELEIQDYLNRQKLVLKREIVLDYWNNKIKDSEILERFLMESSSIQEAFKLFGFTAPKEPASAPSP